MNYIIETLINYGILGIIIVAFSEAIFLPIPMEFISIPTFLLNPSKAFLYSFILILFSTLGSIVGYYVGKTFGSPLLNKFISQENLDKLNKLYSKNLFITVLTSSFTPIPYEAYVLSSGIFNIGFRKFILAAIISRVIRHLPQGILITLYGDALLIHFKKYTLIIALTAFIFIVILKHLFILLNKE